MEMGPISFPPKLTKTWRGPSGVYALPLSSTIHGIGFEMHSTETQPPFGVISQNPNGLCQTKAPSYKLIALMNHGHCGIT